MPISSNHAVTYKRAPVPTATSETNGKRGNIVTRFLAAVWARISPSKPKDAKLNSSGRLKTELYQAGTALKPPTHRPLSQTSLEAPQQMALAEAQHDVTEFRPLPAIPGAAPQALTAFRPLPAIPGAADVKPAPVTNNVPPAPALPKEWVTGSTRSVGTQTEDIESTNMASSQLMPHGPRMFNAMDLLAQKGQLKAVKKEDPQEAVMERVMKQSRMDGGALPGDLLGQLAKAVRNRKIAE